MYQFLNLSFWTQISWSLAQIALFLGFLHLTPKFEGYAQEITKTKHRKSQKKRKLQSKVLSFTRLPKFACLSASITFDSTWPVSYSNLWNLVSLFKNITLFTAHFINSQISQFVSQVSGISSLLPSVQHLKKFVLYILASVF